MALKSFNNHHQHLVPKCSPVFLYGICLVIAQLLIFKFGLSLLYNDTFESQQQNQLYNNDQIPGGSSSNTIRQSQQQQQQQQQQVGAGGTTTVAAAAADGTFNGYPIYYKEDIEDMHTYVHCIGENYQSKRSWMHKSCQFNFFCFDINEKEFITFQSPDEINMYKYKKSRPFLDISQSYLKQGDEITKEDKENDSSLVNTVSLGGINLKWNKNGFNRLEWFPQVTSISTYNKDNKIKKKKKKNDNLLSFYELPPNVVIIPFHSLNGANPGHLVWDDFLPIYTLLTMFQLDNDDTQILPIRYVLKDDKRGLWASCDWKDEHFEACKKMHEKFLPLLLGSSSSNNNNNNDNHVLTTTEQFQFNLNNDKDKPKSNLVCSRNGLAGIGALTDHGVDKMHGWEMKDYETTHNHGRGGMLYAFRNFMMTNIGIPTLYEHKPPFRIIFSEQSSSIPSRILDFTSHIDILKKMFNSEYVSIESYVMKDLSLEEQITISSQASIFISGCGGGAVTATFLPKGGTVILFYLEDGGMKDGKYTSTPARLDWDLFNNLSYLKVHWLPKHTMHNQLDLNAFVTLIQHEIDGFMRELNGYNFFY